MDTAAPEDAFNYVQLEKAAGERLLVKVFLWAAGVKISNVTGPVKAVQATVDDKIHNVPVSQAAHLMLSQQKDQECTT